MRIIYNILGCIVLAVVFTEFSKKLWGNQVKGLICLVLYGISIQIPIGDTVADSETLEVIGDSSSHVGLLIPVVNLPSEEGAIDASITLT
jgi:hypothetical protein